MKTVNWTNFPDSAHSKAIIEASQPGHGAGDRSPATPYQFTLYIMFALYAHLQGDVKPKSQQYHGNVSTYVMPPEYSLFKDMGARGHVLNPDFDNARETPLRAMAYFSWEREKKVFLTRRVYPTYFDFLPHNQVPEGWGALGLMLRDVREKNASAKEYPGYTFIPSVYGKQALLPYLREVKRLKYLSVLVIPVFGNPAPDASTIRGICLLSAGRFRGVPPLLAQKRPTFGNAFRRSAMRLKTRSTSIGKRTARGMLTI